MKPIYVSTGAFKSHRLEEILDLAARHDLRHIELSSGMEYDENVEKLVKTAKNDFAFLIHNYFPAAKHPFALNLASSDTRVQKASLELCKNAVRLVHELGGDFYSVHCGFTFDSSGKELGNKGQLRLSRMPLDLAEKIFVANLRELCRYAQTYRINIAIENNVVAEYAAREKDLYLGVTGEDLQKIVQKVECENLFILLDLAHAKVSDTFVKFGLENMIRELRERVLAIHLSENNGHLDQNRPLGRGSEFLAIIKQFREKTIVLEAYNLEPQEIKEQIEMISEALYK